MYDKLYPLKLYVISLTHVESAYKKIEYVTRSYVDLVSVQPVVGDAGASIGIFYLISVGIEIFRQYYHLQ